MELLLQYIQQLVTLLSAAFWPATVLFGLYYLKHPLVRTLDAIAERIRDPKTDIAFGKDGLEIKSRLQSLEIDHEQTKSLTLQALGVTETPVEPTVDARENVDPDLIKVADEYMAIEHPNWSARVRMKDAAARKLADIVITKNLSRELLARQHHEGLILALAATSHAQPRQGDATHLLHVADEANRLHVKYRIVMALGRLLERGLVDKGDRDSVNALLDSYRHNADKSLLDRIEYTKLVLRGERLPNA